MAEVEERILLAGEAEPAGGAGRPSLGRRIDEVAAGADDHRGGRPGEAGNISEMAAGKECEALTANETGSASSIELAETLRAARRSPSYVASLARGREMSLHAPFGHSIAQRPRKNKQGGGCPPAQVARRGPA